MGWEDGTVYWLCVPRLILATIKGSITGNCLGVSSFCISEARILMRSPRVYILCYSIATPGGRIFPNTPLFCTAPFEPCSFWFDLTLEWGQVRTRSQWGKSQGMQILIRVEVMACQYPQEFWWCSSFRCRLFCIWNDHEVRMGNNSEASFSFPGFSLFPLASHHGQ